jgi:hypothetical protein
VDDCEILEDSVARQIETGAEEQLHEILELSCAQEADGDEVAVAGD